MSTTLLSQVTFLSEPDDVCSYQHEKFPPGRKIGTSNSNRGEKINPSQYREASMDERHEIMIGNDSSKQREEKGSRYLRLPRLTLDKSALPMKGTTCSFVINHNTYLKMKGFDLNHVYSLKRNRRHVDANESRHSSAVNTDLTTLSKSDMTISGPLKSKHSTEKRDSSKKETGRVWRTYESRKPNYGHSSSHFIKEIENDTKVIGQKRVGYLSSKRLGKVMKKTHLRSLLALEEPSAPNTYYMKFTDGLHK